MEKKLFSIIITMIYHPNTTIYWSTFPIKVEFRRYTLSNNCDTSGFRSQHGIFLSSTILNYVLCIRKQAIRIYISIFGGI